MKKIERTNNWHQFATIAALSLMPAFAAYAYGGEAIQTQQVVQKTAETQTMRHGVMLAAADEHGSHSHEEKGHDEMGEMGEMEKGGHHDESFAAGHPAKADQADRTIEIEAVDIAYKPEMVEVKKDETITFKITNNGTLEHEFVIGTAEEQQEHAKEMQAMQANGGSMHHSDPNQISVAPGATETLTWTFTKAVPIEYACHIPGHYQAGMRGTIKVQ